MKYLHFGRQFRNVAHKFEPNSPLGIFRTGLQAGVDCIYGVRADHLNKLGSSLDASLPHLLAVVLHQFLNEGLHILVGLVFAYGLDHVLDYSSHVGCISLRVPLTIASESLPRAVTWGSRYPIFYADTVLMKPLRDFTASILTSISESLRRLP